MQLIKDKIKTALKLKHIIAKLKRQGKKIAFTNGCFDIIHAGHVMYLEKAKRLSDILIVALNSDKSVGRIKGKGRPIVGLRNRLNVVAGLGCVDFVTSFNQDTPWQLINLLKPDILVKGSDWKKKDVVGRGIVESRGGKIITIPYRRGYSTTGIIKRIEKAC